MIEIKEVRIDNKATIYCIFSQEIEDNFITTSYYLWDKNGSMAGDFQGINCDAMTNENDHKILLNSIKQDALIKIAQVHLNMCNKKASELKYAELNIKEMKDNSDLDLFIDAVLPKFQDRIEEEEFQKILSNK